MALEKLTDYLLAFQLTVSVAESLTGGRVATLLTSKPGSSAYFMAGVTAYDNKAKEKILGVPAEIILSDGAVSHNCAKAMADGVRLLANTDYAISTTGIAGPSGGSDLKPVGLVYFAISSQKQTISVEKYFAGDRENISKSAALFAIDYLENFLNI